MIPEDFKAANPYAAIPAIDAPRPALEGNALEQKRLKDDQAKYDKRRESAKILKTDIVNSIAPEHMLRFFGPQYSLRRF